MGLAIALDPQRIQYWTDRARADERLRLMARPRLNKYIRNLPQPKQAIFLCLPHLEALYGGAAGGGKTDALLAGALQYVDVPGYNALLLRRTYGQLSKADSILTRAREWLRHTDAEWSANDHLYSFPSGATLQFGYLQHFKDVYQYDGPSYQYVGFDELTQFQEDQYRFLFSRLRRLTGSVVPLRMRGATNPGGVGHLWVRDRFIKARREAGRFFVPATLKDNKFLDVESYLRSLAELDPITRKQREEGDWDVQREGLIFRREWFGKFVDAVPGECYRVRYWDLAATEPKPGKDPDYTVGTLLARDRMGRFYVEDVRRVRCNPADVERLVLNVARLDGRRVKVRIEQEPGASGKSLVHSYIRLLAGYDVQGKPAGGSKIARWMPFAAQCQAGNVALVTGPWLNEWFDEIVNLATSENAHDDQADSVSGAFSVHISEPRVEFGVSRLGGKR